MKTSSYFVSFAALAAVVIVLRVAGTTLPADKSLPGARTSESNSVPKSVFIVPTSKAEGRDPFFPNSTGGATMVIPSTPTAPAVALVYNGRSGTVEKPLAMINGRTFEQGEFGDVSAPNGGGKISIRCVEIREKSVLVEIVSTKQQQELFLRGN